MDLDAKYRSIVITVSSTSGETIMVNLYKNSLNKITVNLFQFSLDVYGLNALADVKRLATKKAGRG